MRGAPAAVTLHVVCARFPRRVGVEVRGSPADRAAVAPLVRWLRRQRSWPGAGWVSITVASPPAVAAAFSAPGAGASYAALEARAGLTWFFPSEWRGGVLHLFAWRAWVAGRLDEELRHRAARPATRAGA